MNIADKVSSCKQTTQFIFGHSIDLIKSD